MNMTKNQLNLISSILLVVIANLAKHNGYNEIMATIAAFIASIAFVMSMKKEIQIKV